MACIRYEMLYPVNFLPTFTDSPILYGCSVDPPSFNLQRQQE